MNSIEKNTKSLLAKMVATTGTTDELSNYTVLQLREHLKYVAKGKSLYDIKAPTSVIMQAVISRADEKIEVTYLDAESHFLNGDMQVTCKVIDAFNRTEVEGKEVAVELGVPLYSQVKPINGIVRIVPTNVMYAFSARLFTSYFKWDGTEFNVTTGNKACDFDFAFPDLSGALGCSTALNNYFPQGSKLKGKMLNAFLLTFAKDQDFVKSLVYCSSQIKFKDELPALRKKVALEAEVTAHVITRDKEFKAFACGKWTDKTNFVKMNTKFQIIGARLGASNLRNSNPDSVCRVHLYNPDLGYFKLAHALSQFKFRENAVVQVATNDANQVQAIVTALGAFRLKMKLIVVTKNVATFTVANDFVDVVCQRIPSKNSITLEMFISPVGDIAVKPILDMRKAHISSLHTKLSSMSLESRSLVWMPFTPESRVALMDVNGKYESDVVFHVTPLKPYDFSDSVWPYVVSKIASKAKPASTDEALTVTEDQYINTRLFALAALVQYPVSHKTINEALREGHKRHPDLIIVPHEYDYMAHRKERVNVISRLSENPVIFFSSGAVVDITLTKSSDLGKMGIKDKEVKFTQAAMKAHREEKTPSTLVRIKDKIVIEEEEELSESDDIPLSFDFLMTPAPESDDKK